MDRDMDAPTSASDAGDSPASGLGPSSESVLDLAVEYKFPASDPLSIDVAFEATRKRERAKCK